MDDEAIWRAEEAFWTGGEAYYAQALDPECLMVFPGIGALDARAAVEGLKQAPRWRSVVFAQQRIARPADEIATLAYRASAQRDWDAPYEAWCSSSYRHAAGRWLLFQHQQTPVPGNPEE